MKGINEVVFQSCSKHCKLKEFDDQITAGRDKVEKGHFPLYGSTGVIGTTAAPSYHEPLVLVARVGSIGCVQFVNIPCGVSDNTIVIRCGSKAKYVYYYLQNYNFERITSGTTQPLIAAKDVKHIDIPIIDSANELKAINTLDTLNMKLELESNLYNTILKQKTFLLQQMFI
ncbi:MAG: restriction endonuclease subunit S [Paraprevotella clara]|uniref:restriction endonuclease subunit S n=1 Tax=Paraprevotella clara TaxID=454154 RepID=UPI003A227322